MSVTLGTMDWRLGVDNTGFQQGLSNAESQAKSMGKNITGALATGAKLAFAGAVVGVGALGAVLVSSVKEAAAAEEATAQLNAVLASTKGVAGMTREALEEHALALSKVTRFEDDAILAGNAVLLTFTNIGKDIFPRATEATLDLSTAFGMDLQSATMMVGKALNDPIAGITALSRAGVQFTEDQKEMIKGMVEAGDAAGAQKLILQELELQIGGSAVAAGSTMTGQMEIMKNALGNVKEEIGGALIPVITDMLVKFGPGMIEAAGQFASWAVEKLIPALQDIGVWLETNIPIAVAAMKQAWIDAQPTIDQLRVIFEQIGVVLGKVGDWLQLNIPIAVAATRQAVIDAQPTMEIIRGVFRDIALVLSTIWTWLSINVPKAVEATRNAVIAAQPTLEIIRGVFRDIATVLSTVWDWLSIKIPAAVLTVLGAFETAQGAIQGVIDKIQAAIDKIREAIGALQEFVSSSWTSGAGGNDPVRDFLANLGGGSASGTSTRGVTSSTTPMRGMELAPITVNVYAAGGGPDQVRNAANTGTLEALRTRGYR